MASAFQCHRLAWWMFTISATTTAPPENTPFLRFPATGSPSLENGEKEVIERHRCREERDSPPGKPVASKEHNAEVVQY